MKIFVDTNVIIDYWGADVIVTRDKTGFVNSPIKVLSPAEFLEIV